MNSTIKKIVTSINSIGSLSRKIIIHGVQFATGLLTIALVLYFINNSLYNFDYNIAFITFSIAKTGLTIFAEAVIGGLVVDHFVKKI
ncbi:MAG: hypothetical protein JG777_322 [Clostridia bacterium]|jgi:hypothetical protein|uniref:hypothetical protein n=1 Tax=Petroclostridium xylanilyticum TaxID=1792311 RepID=UPI000B9808EC|nr:hypothetical protein [Petroclostridium xylanilyticum]MBZ4644833.1 hypothetical protein [Clostridia bacterium]